MDNEYKNSPSCPVKDLLHIVQQDDIEHIRDALLEVIDKSYPNGEIYLYQHGYSLYESEDRDFSPSLLACLAKIEKNCKESEKKSISSNLDSSHFDGFKYLPTNEHVQIFTVENEHSNRGLLITINKQIIDQQYIETLLSAYNHQVRLLRNKDTDSLTGLLNRQSFNTKLDKLHNTFSFESRSQDDTVGYVFTLLDIDFFKSINDNFGHVYGDEVLILFSNEMKKTFRDCDMLFRYGGEEFAVLLNNVDLKQAKTILNRFRCNIENIILPMGNAVTVSIGYCAFTNQVAVSTIIERADKALYFSKENGRNKANSFEKLFEENKIKDIIIEEGVVELF